MYATLHFDAVTSEPVGIWWLQAGTGVPSCHYEPGTQLESVARELVGDLFDELPWAEIVDRLLTGEDGLTFTPAEGDGDPKGLLEQARRHWAGTGWAAGTPQFEAAARRRRLADRAGDLADQIVAETVRWTAPVRVSDAHHFRIDTSGGRLVVLVASGESDRQIDEALAAGLALQGDRDLHVVLPATARGAPATEPCWQATADRMAWIDTPVWLWAHDDRQVRPLLTPRDSSTLRRARQEGPIPGGDFNLGTNAAWVQDLRSWADTQVAAGILQQAHRTSYAAWHADGRKVLEIKRSRGGLAVVAGVKYSNPAHGPLPHELTVTGPLGGDQMHPIIRGVEIAVQRRFDGVDDRDVEARLLSGVT